MCIYIFVCIYILGLTVLTYLPSNLPITYLSTHLST